MSNNSTNKKEKQLDNLINLVENHTRTERHLEQYSHIGSKENNINNMKQYAINNMKEKQQHRLEQLSNLSKKSNSNDVLF